MKTRKSKTPKAQAILRTPSDYYVMGMLEQMRERERQEREYYRAKRNIYWDDRIKE